MNHPLGGESSGSAEPQSDPPIESQCGGTREATQDPQRVPMRRGLAGKSVGPGAAGTHRQKSLQVAGPAAGPAPLPPRTRRSKMNSTDVRRKIRNFPAANLLARLAG